jgi:branched-chain amino acid transport system permease protein
MGYEITLATSMCISVVFALSLNLITGFCGQISLGHAAFLGVGAYTTALLSKAGLPFPLDLLAAAVAAAALGFVVGLSSLRVRHDFLAITTMGFGFLFLGVVRQQDWLGGEMGVSAIPGPGLSKPGFLAFVAAVALMVAVFSAYLKRSWLGFSFAAIADDEDTARVVALDVASYKLLAFVLGTAIAGIAGGLYAHHVRFISPDSFGFVESIAVLSMVIVGGIGSVTGVAITAMVLTALPLWFQVIEDYKLLLYSALLFLTMQLCEDGLSGFARRLIRARRQRARRQRA